MTDVLLWATKQSKTRRAETNPRIRNQNNRVSQESSNIKGGILERLWKLYNVENFGSAGPFSPRRFREREREIADKKNPQKQTKLTWEETWKLSTPNKVSLFLIFCVCFLGFEQVGIVLWGSRFSQPFSVFGKKKKLIIIIIILNFKKYYQYQTTLHQHNKNRILLQPTDTSKLL